MGIFASGNGGKTISSGERAVKWGTHLIWWLSLIVDVRKVLLPPGKLTKARDRVYTGFNNIIYIQQTLVSNCCCNNEWNIVNS